VEKYGRAVQATDGNIMRPMCFECWITEATGTHTEYVIIIAFPVQERLRDRTLVIRYTSFPVLLLNENVRFHFTCKPVCSL
jgi:hypothetical protein